MILVGCLVAVSILVRDIECYTDARFVMIKGGLDETTTKQLLTDFHNDRPTAVAQMRSESKFCARPEDEKEAICVRIFNLPEVHSIVNSAYDPQSHTNQFNMSSYQCRKRKIGLKGSGLVNGYKQKPKDLAKFFRCPTSVPQTPELASSDLYVTTDYKGGYYLFGSPWGDDFVQPIAHIEKQNNHFAVSRPSSPDQYAATTP